MSHVSKRDISRFEKGRVSTVHSCSFCKVGFPANSYLTITLDLPNSTAIAAGLGGKTYIENTAHNNFPLIIKLNTSSGIDIRVLKPNATNDGAPVDVDILLLWVKMSPRVASLVVLNVERRIGERMKDDNMERVNKLRGSFSFIYFVLCFLSPNISASARQ